MDCIAPLDTHSPRPSAAPDSLHCTPRHTTTPRPTPPPPPLPCTPPPAPSRHHRTAPPRRAQEGIASPPPTHPPPATAQPQMDCIALHRWTPPMDTRGGGTRARVRRHRNAANLGQAGTLPSQLARVGRLSGVGTPWPPRTGSGLTCRSWFHSMVHPLPPFVERKP